MILVKLWGGMCNQMFQYAFGYALARKYNDELCFDVDFYNNQPGHVGKRKVISQNEFPRLVKIKAVNRNWLIEILENKYVLHLLRYTIGCNLLIHPYRLVVERLHKHYDKIPYKKKLINFYDGYWQSDAYFDEFGKELREQFTPSLVVQEKVKAWRSSIDSSCCVAVHIRRGDYLSKINQGKITTTNDNEYYLKAFEIAKQALDNPTFCFFSDDIEWCKKTFSNVLKNVVFVENQTPDAALIDLFSIAECEHGIMSPSTFSWWGNWLRNPNKDGMVIYPKGDYSDKFITNPRWIEVK